MIDIKLIRENRELVKENIKKKFQDQKLPFVDEVYEMDIENRKLKVDLEEKRNKVNSLSKEIGELMRNGKKEEADKIKEEINVIKEAIVLDLKTHLMLKYNMVMLINYVHLMYGIFLLIE